MVVNFLSLQFAAGVRIDQVDRHIFPSFIYSTLFIGVILPVEGLPIDG